MRRPGRIDEGATGVAGGALRVEVPPELNAPPKGRTGGVGGRAVAEGATTSFGAALVVSIKSEDSLSTNAFKTFSACGRRPSVTAFTFS